MKRIVRSSFVEGLLFGLGSFLLVCIVEEETVLSHLVVWGLAATMILQAWSRRRREKARSRSRKPL